MDHTDNILAVKLHMAAKGLEVASVEVTETIKVRLKDGCGVDMEIAGDLTAAQLEHAANTLLFSGAG